MSFRMFAFCFTRRRFHFYFLHPKMYGHCSLCVVYYAVDQYQSTVPTISGILHSWWRHQTEIFSRYWPFARVIHQTPVNSPHKGQWWGALMFLWSAPCINGWLNNREAGDLRRHRAHYNVIVMHWRRGRYIISPVPVLQILVFYVKMISDSRYKQVCSCTEWHQRLQFE